MRQFRNNGSKDLPLQLMMDARVKPAHDN